MKPLIAIPAIAALKYRAWSHQSLTPLGIAVAGITATVHALHPWSVFFTLLGVFFLAGTAATKVKHDVKAKLTQSSTGTSGGEGPRTHVQVFANTLVASILILFHTWQTRKTGLNSRDGECWRKGSNAVVVGIVANYAAVASDTLSSELGILSKSKPRLITAPWRVVPPGTNGGVTLTGLGAGLLGSLLIAVTSTSLLPFCVNWDVSSKAQYTLSITAAGFCGTLLDSLLGALLQASVVDVRSGKIVEGDGGRKVLVHSDGSMHVKQATKLRSQVVSRAEGQESVAKTTALDKSPNASNWLKTVESDRHESRKLATGNDILDNNGVNLLMAALISIGAMLVTCIIWDLSFSSIMAI